MKRHCGSQRTRALGGGGERGSVAMFVQPQHCNWAQYQLLARVWRGRFWAVGVLAVLVAVLVLSWRTVEGEHVSQERWFFAIGSGLMLAWISRLTVLVLLATPKRLTFEKGSLHLSGWWGMRVRRALRWSLRRNAFAEKRRPSCAELRLIYLWLGHEREWRMLVDDEADAARLLRILQERLPQAAGDEARSRQSVITIESGALSR